MFNSFRIILVVLISFAVEMNADLINVALSKGTIQSSFYENSSRAVDGITNQDHVHYPCAHTDADYQPYWEVDLGTPYVIALIKVYNRLDCCSERLSNVEVNVSTNHVTYAQYGYRPGTIGSTFEFYLENPVVVGRWVKIYLLETTGYMALCEVDIMSNMTYRRDYLRAIKNVEGTGTTIMSFRVVSQSQCVFLCTQKEACHSVNVRQDMPSPIECQLLNQVSYRTTSDKNVKFWTMATDI